MSKCPLHSYSILLTCLLCLGCFSTIAPETNDPGGGSGGPGTGTGVAEVRGKVLLYRGPGDWDNSVTGVQILWLDANGAEIGEDTVRSNYGGDVGNYYSSTTDPRVKQVKVAALKCDYDSNDPAPRYTCCLDPVPCPGGCVSPWGTSYRMPVVVGSAVYRELRIACGND